jgi:outer membrane biosynthesis protein TonB
MWKASVLAALLVLSARPAFAANPDLRRALKLYDDLDYMPALDALQAADARAGSTKREKVEIQIYIGMISIALGDEAKARTAFAKAIALDHRAKAPNGASPKVAGILDQLRAEAPAESAAPSHPEPSPQPEAQPPAQAPPPEQPQQQAPNPYPYGSPYYAPQQYAPQQGGQAPPQQAPPPQQVAPYAYSTDQPTASTSTQAESGSNTWSAVTGFTALALGAVGVGVGVYFQLAANSDVTTGNGETTAAGALNDQASANQAWTYALVGYVAGGVLLVGGLTLVIVHYAAGPSHPAEPHAGELSLTPSGVALSF